MEESSMIDLDESNSKTLWQILQWKAKYLIALVGAMEGICVKKFVITLGAVPSGLSLWGYIVWQ